MTKSRYKGRLRIKSKLEFRKQVKQHNKTIVLLTVLFIAMLSISMFLYFSTPSISCY
ncbi:hypothetical protein HMPREF9626_1061 [Streptococcus parasanguinis F0405]|uniref:Uncharacterized protein n=1 Tax=Streptococcus parasanguinis F0405 TaxID=905067 RepID=E3CB13_STRPA|nr:hypothetical protein HMPREF9626_1061 [Streptococcus parasanguinis F0405]